MLFFCLADKDVLLNKRSTKNTAALLFSRACSVSADPPSSIRRLLSTGGRDVVRACFEIHFRNLHAPHCGILPPNSVNVARYASLIWRQSPTMCDAHLTESNFQTRSSIVTIYSSR